MERRKAQYKAIVGAFAAHDSGAKSTMRLPYTSRFNCRAASKISSTRDGFFSAAKRWPFPLAVAASWRGSFEMTARTAPASAWPVQQGRQGRLVDEIVTTRTQLENDPVAVTSNLLWAWNNDVPHPLARGMQRFQPRLSGGHQFSSAVSFLGPVGVLAAVAGRIASSAADSANRCFRCAAKTQFYDRPRPSPECRPLLG